MSTDDHQSRWQTVFLEEDAGFEAWRLAARSLLAQRVFPHCVTWSSASGQGGLFSSQPPEKSSSDHLPMRVPQAFVSLAQEVIQHRSLERFSLLYRLLWRLQTERSLLRLSVDPDVSWAERFAKSVRRDAHKMKAFVRFREVPFEGGVCYVAWFEPEHYSVEATAPFFVRRFPGMRWSILTPDRCAHWDGESLKLTSGASLKDAPTEDAMEDMWRSYYASIFNPARLKVAMMRSEMPVKYWRNLPEARLIKPLIETAAQRVKSMVDARLLEPNPRPQRKIPPQTPPVSLVSTDDGLEGIRREAAGCRACPLWEPATQTVFGEGPQEARVMFIGEQPGDKEDIEGRPFVGPAGKVFNEALQAAALDRTRVYVTNAVKHFKFVPKGRLRLHQKPVTAEIKACRPWLEREMALIQPKLVVALGATAAQSLFGKPMTIGRNRGVLIDLDFETKALITVHPSYLLRLPDEALRASETQRFVEDLKLVIPFV